MIKANLPALVVAPMDGVTDALMRDFLTARVPFTYCVTEFIRISGLVPPSHVFMRDVPELRTGCSTGSGVPVGVQLLGGDPDLLAESAVRAVSLGASVIDLNFGCPAPTVNRHDGGATLLKFPDRIEAIVRTVRGALPQHVPLSAKLRLGWEDPTAIYENAERAARGGVSWITIHGRTKMQGYTPPAYWRPIGDVRRSLSIPVVANGEIWTVEDLKRCVDETGCNQFMLGRGALADPTLVGACARYLGIDRDPPLQISDTLSFSVWRVFIDGLVRKSRDVGEGDRKTLARVKQWLNYAHHRRMIDWFDLVKRCRDSRELSVALDTIAVGRAEEAAEQWAA